MRALIKLWADLMLNDCQKRALDAPVRSMLEIVGGV